MSAGKILTLSDSYYMCLNLTFHKHRVQDKNNLSASFLINQEEHVGEIILRRKNNK